MEKMILPLGNGVGVYEKGRLCVSMIDSEGNKRVGGKKVKMLKKWCFLPFLRGLTYFLRGIWLYISSYFLMNELEDRPENEKNKSFKIAKNFSIASSYLVLIAMLVAGFLFGFLGLGVLPSYLFRKAFSSYSNYYFRSFMISLIRVAIIYIIFTILRFVPFMSGLYGFNGAGSLLLQGKEDRIAPRTYPLNFLNFLLNVFVFSTFVISLIAVNISWLLNFVINLGIFLVIVPFVYEILRFASKTKIGGVKDITLLTNWLVNIKPNITHSEIIQVAQRELSSYDGFVKTEKGRISMSSLYAEMETKLKTSDRYEESDRDWIVATVLNKNRAEMKLERSVSDKEYREIMRICDRRAKGEPLSNIFGFVEFYGLKFDVNKKVLSPRMETEILVEEAIKKINEFEAKSVLDLCTGSGAIAVSIAKFTDCKVFASDISKQALSVAEVNAKKNGVKVDFCQSDLTLNLKKGKKYDIIISNPPYIKREDMEKLDVEVKNFDPKLALDGGEDGLDFYRRIVEEAHTRLNKKGWLMFEVGLGQADAVAELMQKNGYDSVLAIKDYNRIERVVYGRLSK